MSAPISPTHTPMGSPRAAAPRQHTHHRLVRNAVSGVNLFNLFIVALMFSMLAFASSVSAMSASSVYMDLFAALSDSAHSLVSGLGVPAIFRHVDLSVSAPLSNVTASPVTAHAVPTLTAAPATAITMLPVSILTSSVDSIKITSVSAWIRAANLSALTDSELESAIVRLVAIRPPVARKQQTSQVARNQESCPRLDTPHVFVVASCGRLSNSDSCERLAQPHPFVFESCLKQDAPTDVAVIEPHMPIIDFVPLPNACARATSTLQQLATTRLRIFVTATFDDVTFARRRIVMQAHLVVSYLVGALVTIALVLVAVARSANQSSANLDTLRVELDDALAQRDLALVERADFLAVQVANAEEQSTTTTSVCDVADAERDTAAKQLNASHAQAHKAMRAKVMSFATLASFVVRGAMSKKRRADSAVIVAEGDAKIAQDGVKAAWESRRKASVAAEVLLVRVRVAENEKVAAEAELKLVQVELAATREQLASSNAKLENVTRRAAVAELGAANARATAAEYAEQLTDRNEALRSAMATNQEQADALLECHQLLKNGPGYCSFCKNFKCSREHANHPAHLRQRLWNGAKAFASLIGHAQAVGIPTSDLPVALARQHDSISQPAQRQHQTQQYQPRPHQQQPQQYHPHQQQSSQYQPHHQKYQQHAPQPYPVWQQYPHPHPHSQLHHQHQQVYFVPLPAHPPAFTQHVPPAGPQHAAHVRFPEPRPGLDSAVNLTDDYP